MDQKNINPDPPSIKRSPDDPGSVQKIEKIRNKSDSEDGMS